MSKAQLQTNNTKYSQLIGLLRSKAVGGGSGLEACPLTISKTDICTIHVFYTTLENETPVAKYEILTGRNGLTTTCLKNSTITILRIVGGYAYLGKTITGADVVYSNTDDTQMFLFTQSDATSVSITIRTELSGGAD